MARQIRKRQRCRRSLEHDTLTAASIDAALASSDKFGLLTAALWTIYTSMTLEEIQSNFELLDDWEDRYRYVIELGRQLPPMPAELKSDQNKVRGCASQVWLASTESPSGSPGGTKLSFQGDSDAMIVKGLIAVLFAIFNGRSADTILATDPQPIFKELGLSEHLTPQRSNGLKSMVERVRADARTALEPT